MERDFYLTFESNPSSLRFGVSLIEFSKKLTRMLKTHIQGSFKLNDQEMEKLFTSSLEAARKGILEGHRFFRTRIKFNIYVERASTERVAELVVRGYFFIDTFRFFVRLGVLKEPEKAENLSIFQSVSQNDPISSKAHNIEWVFRDTKAHRGYYENFEKEVFKTLSKYNHSILKVPFLPQERIIHVVYGIDPGYAVIVTAPDQSFPDVKEASTLNYPDDSRYNGIVAIDSFSIRCRGNFLRRTLCLIDDFYRYEDPGYFNMASKLLLTVCPDTDGILESLGARFYHLRAEIIETLERKDFDHLRGLLDCVASMFL